MEEWQEDKEIKSANPRDHFTWEDVNRVSTAAVHWRNGALIASAHTALHATTRPTVVPSSSRVLHARYQAAAIHRAPWTITTAATCDPQILRRRR